MHLVAAFLSAFVLSCGTSSKDDADTGGAERVGTFPCQPSQPAPYANGIPYLGIHADAGNSDVVQCESASNFSADWHALEGLGLTQPNTFSPDGKTIYATTTHPEPDGCRLWALDAQTGQTQWCRTYEASIGQSAVEVDADGNLYFTVDSSVVALTPNGDDRWSAGFSAGGAADAPWGVHFTPDGLLATVTTSGGVHLLDRTDGRILSSLSIADVWGYVPPATLDLGAGADIDLLDFLPSNVANDIRTVWGETASDGASAGFAGFLGAGGFVDNTLGIDPEGRLYVVGGGPDESHGALVQIRVESVGDAIELVPGWTAPITGGSATSPSISKDGRYVVIGDGSSTEAILQPSSAQAHVRVADIFACDANNDVDPDPEVCGFAFSERLERAPLPGSPAILPDGTVIFYEFSLNFAYGPDARDVVALSPDGILWEATLPDNLDWNSVVTVTDNHIIGTASRVTLSDQQLLGLSFPVQTEDYLVILDRSDGTLLRQLPVVDDSSATVTIGPDGALYVGVLGLLSTLSIDDRPDLGLVRYVPLVR